MMMDTTAIKRRLHALNRMTVANGCTPAEARAAAELLAKMLRQYGFRRVYRGAAQPSAVMAGNTRTAWPTSRPRQQIAAKKSSILLAITAVILYLAYLPLAYMAILMMLGAPIFLIFSMFGMPGYIFVLAIEVPCTFGFWWLVLGWSQRSWKKGFVEASKMHARVYSISIGMCLFFGIVAGLLHFSYGTL